MTGPTGEGRDTCPRFSHDSRKIAFVRFVSRGMSEVYQIAADGSRLRQVTDERRTIRGLDWSADGQEIIYSPLHQGTCQLRQIAASGGGSTLLSGLPTSAVDASAVVQGQWIAFT